MKWKTAIASLLIISLFAIPAWSDESLNIADIKEEINVDFEKTDVKKVLEKLIETTNLDIAFDECVRGKVTLKVENVQLNNLFKIVLEYAALNYKQDGDKIWITCQDAFQSQQSLTTFGKWIWVSGDEKTDQRGVYGTQGIADSENKPGARTSAIGWTDSEDNLWLFGGMGFTDKRNTTYLNDLWKFDGTSWTWVSGDSTGNEKGVYGVKGVAAADNKPGSRSGSVSWIDPQGNFWLFGGGGYAEKGFIGYFNDLWKFDGKMWTWVSGDQKINRTGEYGDRGVAAYTNLPGARCDAVGWIDTAGNLWLFGGRGYDQYGADGFLNDLWKFDGTNWTWVAGGSTRYEKGDYGTKGIAAVTNKPGARVEAVSWVDSDGVFWLFGGLGYANISWMGVKKTFNPNIFTRNFGVGYLNDLWKFDGKNWTWIFGEGEAFFTRVTNLDNMNYPFARYGSVCWRDTAGRLWLFGGEALVEYSGVTNDLWAFDGTKWIQIFAGIERKERRGIYGTKGVAAEKNTPPARSGAVGWVDSKGNLWIFGGRTQSDYFNDLWKFEPQNK